MAQAFNLTAQLQLQAPNTQQVAQQIQSDLGSININVGVQQNAQALAGVNNQLARTDKAAKSASKSMNFLNKGLAEAARRFSVITVATGSFIALARGIRNSVGAALEFERELVKISQVTGTSVGSLDQLQKRVTQLSVNLGVANASLLQTARVLTQAGLSARKTSQALEVLANTTLAPSFENIIDTTEGAIAILNQFGREAAKTGNDIKFLEQSLDAINQVSKNFAVESSDLISVVRRTGGVFQAAGGNLKELIALFTSVRQTTRESAETIATGFRTIFTRLQRKDTLEALKEIGIVLTDVEGKFVGPLKAIEALSTGLAGLDPKDVRFNEIVEQLGGFRQIGKVIPLLKQYAVAQNALAVANNSAGSTAKDAQSAQQSLAQQFAKVREQFDALIRKFAGSDTFQGLASTIIKLAGSFLKFAESLENVLPLLTAVAAIKIGQNLAPGVASLIGGGRRKNAGGKILAMNSGGSVPGTGNRDTVPAMLTPGEFVIRKGSVQKLGAENLARMNEGGRAAYNKGTTGTGVKKSDAKKRGEIVKASGRTQASHIGAAIDISDAELKKFFSDYGGLTGRGNAKFKRSFAQNVAGISTTKTVNGKETNKSAAELYGKEYKTALEKTISSPAKLNQARQAIGLRAQNPTLLNWPASFNQALRVTDPNLVAKDDLIAATSKEKNLVKIGNKATSAKFSANSKIRSDLVAGIRGTSTRPENTRNGRPAFDVDNELDGLKSIFINSIESQDEKVAAQLLRDADFIFKGGKSITSKGKTRSSQERFSKKNFVQKALGGVIQKFAAGGIVDQGAAGAAILDPVGTSSSNVAVSNQDVKSSFKEFKSLPKGKDPVSKFYKAKNFNITKSGLNQETSDKFKNILEDGLVAGINSSAAALSNDLGTPSATISGGETANFVKSINTSIFGRLYETVIESISNKGKFSGSDPDRPFDAEGGLPAGLKDNFKGLPKKFIDLKSSEGAANSSNLKGKVVDQIKRELIQDGILNEQFPRKDKFDKDREKNEAKAISEREKRAKASQGFDATVDRRRKKLNSGGGVSGEDTVPALLTPGEFVFSKKASQSIGYGNLSKMNTQGVQGFNKGGAVGVKRYANGTGPTGVPSGNSTTPLFDGGSLDLAGIQAAIATLEATANDYTQSLADNSASLVRAKAANESTTALVAEKAEAEATLAAVYNKLGTLYESEEFAKLEKAEAALVTTTKKQDKQLEALIAAEKEAELEARKGAERQPKKERIGPSGPQPKGDAVSIGKTAAKGLQAIADSGVKLAGVQNLYLQKLQSGLSSQDALNETSQEAAALIAQVSKSTAANIQANQAVTAAYNENGNLTDEEIANRRVLLAKIQNQSDASQQVEDVLQQYYANLQTASQAAADNPNVGSVDRPDQAGVATEALQQAINSVTAAYGVQLTDSATLQQAVLQRALEEKELAIADQQLAESTMQANAAAQQSLLQAEEDGAASGGSGGGSVSGSGDCVTLCKETIDALCECLGKSGSGGGGDDSPAGVGPPAASNDPAVNANAALAAKLKSFGDKANKFAQITQKVSGAFNAVASAAIGLTFLLGTLIQQFSTASEAEKEQQQAGLAAVNAFIAIGAQAGSLALQFIATVASTAALVAAKGAEIVFSLGSGAADTAEAVASVGAAGADTAEAAATVGVTAALGPFGLAVAALGVALLALVAVVALAAAAFSTAFLTSIYASAVAVKRLEQSIDKFTKTADEELAKAGSVETVSTASESTFVEAQVSAAVNDFRKGIIEVNRINLATAAGTEQAFSTLGGALEGFAIGTALAGPTGAILGAIAGAFGFFNDETETSFVNFSKQVEDAEKDITQAIKARAKEEAAITRAATGFATTTFRATKAVAEFDQALRDAKKVGLDASDTLGLLSNNTAALITTFDANEQKIEGANKELADLAPKLQAQGLITSTGDDTTNQAQILKGLSPDEAAAASQLLDTYKFLSKIQKQAGEANAKLLAKINAQENQLRQQQLRAIGETISEIERNAGLGGGGRDISDIVSAASARGGGSSALAGNIFEELKTAAPQLAAALQSSQKQVEILIKKEFAARKDAANAVNDNAKVLALETQERVRLRASLKQFEKAELEQIRAKLIEVKNAKTALRAGLKLIQIQEKSAVILGGFNSALIGATSTLARVLGNLDNAISLAQGGQVDVGGFENQIQAIELGTENANAIDNKSFDDAIKVAVDAAPKGSNAKEIGEEVKLFRKLPAAIEKTVRKADPVSGKAGGFGSRTVGTGGDKTNKDAVDRIFNDIDKNLGGDLAGTDLGEVVRREIEKKIIDGKPIDFAAIQDIIDATGEVAEGQKEVLIRALQIQGEYAQNLAKINNAIIAARGNLDQARGKVEDVRERVAERNSSARGGQRSRNDREQGRRRAANQRLGFEARREGAVAGDVKATSDALAELERKAQEAAVKSEKAGNALDKAEFADQANKFADGAAKARAELERLANQSARAADIEEDLANLRKQGAQIEDLQEKLAFGSDEQRVQIGEDFKNLNTALAQGGLQGANEDQRASVGRALDSVSDQVINFEGQDLLGSEVKKIIAARETGRIGAGGVNDFLKKIRAAENPLLAELNDLGQQEIAAAQALADSSERQINVLLGIRSDLKTAFDKEITQNADGTKNEAEARSKQGGKTREDTIAQLDAEIAELDAGITNTTDSINLLDSEIKVLQASFRKLNDFITALDTNEERSKALAERNTNIRDREKSEKIDEKVANDTLTFQGQKLQKVERDNVGNVSANPAFEKIAAAQEQAKDEDRTVDVTINLPDGTQKTFSVTGDETFTDTGGKSLTGREATQSVANANVQRGKEVQDIKESSGKDFPAGPDNFNTSVGNLQKSVDKNTAIISQKDAEELQAAQDREAEENKGNTNARPIFEAQNATVQIDNVNKADKEISNLANGGPIYRAGGGSIFKPKGTDTVPAMLTPGEFVIRKSAVDAIGSDALSAINSGSATVYKQDGGSVAKIPSGSDIRNIFLQTAQNPKLLRAALTQGFEGKSLELDGDGKLKDSDKKNSGKRAGTTLFGAISRLSKAGALNPSDLGDVNAIAIAYDNLSKLSGAKTVGSEGGTRTGLPISNATKNVLEAFSGLGENAKLTANQKRVAQEFVNSGEAGKVEQTLASLQKQTSFPNKDTAPVKFANALLNSSKKFTVDPILGYEQIVGQQARAYSKRLGSLRTLNNAFAGIDDAVEGQDIPNLATIRESVSKGTTYLQNMQAAEQEGGGRKALEDAIAKGGTGELTSGSSQQTNSKKEKLKGRLQKDFQLLQSAGILRLASGGSVNGEDTVPAMLTPGEFVMNPKSVQKYGVGYMRQLNRGNVPGFKKGGLVAGAGVAYRANGSQNPESGGGSPTVYIDPGPLQGILEEFNAAFGARLDNMVEQFSMVKDSINGLASAISGGMVVQHQFSGDMTLAFSIANGDALKNQIAEAITPKLKEIITTELDRRLSDNNFKAGG